MKVIFLGTNGWYDTKIGNTACILLETKSEYIVLDAGYGIHKIDRYIKTNKPIYLFLSHFHLDHIIGLHTLNKFNFSQGINIYGPLGLRKALNTIINLPYSLPFHKLKIRIKLHELKKGSRLPINGQFLKLKHSSLCYGYRLNIWDKVITYCTDTGICNNLFKLAKNADLLILECSYETGQNNPKWPHLNPQEAACVAGDAKAKKLILTHFDAAIYPGIKDRIKARGAAKKIFFNTRISFDGLKVGL